MQLRRVRVRPVDVLALAAVALLVAVAYAVPHWATRYGAALLAFSIWMAWFVETTAGLLRQRRE